MKKMIVSGWDEEKKISKKRGRERERVHHFKISVKTQNPTKGGGGGGSGMMIRIWFRYTLNNEVFK